MYKISIDHEDDMYLAVTVAKQIAGEMGFAKHDETKIVVSIMELARNMILYANNGDVWLKPLPPNGIEVIAKDKGPGIEDLEAILAEKKQSKTGLGLGLAGVRRLMDVFEITTERHSGTTIKVQKRRQERRHSYDR